MLTVIEKVKSEFDVSISLDTYKYKVAAEGIKAGIDIVNDIWGLKYDNGEMARLVAENNIPYILMHNRKNDNYKDFFKDYISDFEESLRIAEDADIQKDKIILDPGVGFAKNVEKNLEVIRRIDELKERFNLPVLLGTSNKSVIGLTLNLPVEDRLEGTLSTSVVGVMKGACILRVHDVRANKRAMDMTKAIMS